MITASRIIFLLFIGLVWGTYAFSPNRNAAGGVSTLLAISESRAAVFGKR